MQQELRIVLRWHDDKHCADPEHEPAENHHAFEKRPTAETVFTMCGHPTGDSRLCNRVESGQK